MSAHPEIGPQRRTALGGRPLHACCICNNVELWRATWSHHSSIKDMDDCAPLAKFCSSACARKAGPNCENVTEAMKRAARDLEFRPPKPYVEPPRPRVYGDAVADQRRAKEREARLAEWRRGRDDAGATP